MKGKKVSKRIVEKQGHFKELQQLIDAGQKIPSDSNLMSVLRREHQKAPEEGIAFKQMTPPEKKAYLSTWAEKKFESLKTELTTEKQSWQEIDSSIGVYRPFSRIIVVRGSWHQVLAPCFNVLPYIFVNLPPSPRE